MQVQEWLLFIMDQPGKTVGSMKNIFKILLLIPFWCNAQSGVVLRNDTLFGFNPETGVYTQLTKLDTSAIPGFTVKTKGLITWGNVAGKPSTYTPATHSHAISDITNLQSSLDAKGTSNFDGAYSSLSGKPDLSAYSLTSHSHAFAAITSPPTTVAGYGITDAPKIVAAINLTAQAANIGTTTLYAVPSAGFYRVSIYITVTQAATTSSTMPSTTIVYTDGNSGTNSHSTTTTATNTGNSVTTSFAQTTYVLYAKSSTNITYATGSYASSGGTPMQYALRIRVESL